MKRSPSATIWASPLVDCSSSRSRPSPASHSRPVAPVSTGEAVFSGSEPDGRRLLVNLMRAVTPSTAGAFSASWTARSRGLGSGLGALLSAACAIPAPAATATSTAAIVTRRRVDAVRSRLIACQFYGRDFESSLTTSVKRAPSTSTRPPWRSAIARTIASPRPEPSPRACGPRWKRSKIRSGSSGPGPSSSTRTKASVAVAADGHRHAPGAVLVRVADEVVDGALERGALALGPGVALDHDVLGEVREPDRLGLQRRRRVLAGQRQQVVEQLAEPVRAGLDVGHDRGIGAVLGQVGGVAAQRGERRAQLVRRVADEPVLGLLRPLERGRASRSASPPVRRPRRATSGAGQPLRRSPDRPIARAPAESRVSGRSARRVSSVARPAASTAATSAQTPISVRARSSVRSISARSDATITAPPAASPAPSSPSGAV